MRSHDTLYVPPTSPAPELWLVGEMAGLGDFRPLLSLVQTRDGRWQVGNTGAVHGNVLDAAADAVRLLAPLADLPEVLRITCPACGTDTTTPMAGGLVWNRNPGKLVPTVQAIHEGNRAHAAECPMQVDDIVDGWLAAAGWSGCEDEVDRRDGPFTTDARNLATTDVYAFLGAAETEDVVAYLRNVVPVSERYGDGGPHEWLGHDIWLTQNHAGAGFWDREWLKSPGKAHGKDLSTRLTEATHHALHERYVHVTEGGEVDVE